MEDRVKARLENLTKEEIIQEYLQVKVGDSASMDTVSGTDRESRLQETIPRQTLTKTGHLFPADTMRTSLR